MKKDVCKKINDFQLFKKKLWVSNSKVANFDQLLLMDKKLIFFFGIM